MHLNSLTFSQVASLELAGYAELRGRQYPAMEHWWQRRGLRWRGAMEGLENAHMEHITDACAGWKQDTVRAITG